MDNLANVFTSIFLINQLAVFKAFY